jgi:hypothetical protein
VPSKACSVSFTDSEGITHSVEVSASSLYEACVMPLAEFRRSRLIGDSLPAPAIRLVVAVRLHVGPSVTVVTLVMVP